MPKKEHTHSTENEKIGVKKPAPFNKTAAGQLRENLQKPPTATHLVQGIHKGDTTALSRAITLVESTAKKHRPQAREIVQLCLPHAGNSIRVGITGVPGVGKSTFIERLGTRLTTAGNKVAVLAVDPTSSLGHGSILADKTRMEELVKQPLAYIRPSASGDSLGGVTRKTREAITLCEAAGFTIILIETVGVGQSETAVHSMTDFFLLLKLAGAGDELQGIKRGIVEMADTVVINKADGENIRAAKLARAAFNRALHLYPPKESGWVPKTLTCSALANEGIDTVWQIILEYVQQTKQNGHFAQKRNEQKKYWLQQTIEGLLKLGFFEHPQVKQQLEKMTQEVTENKITPFLAAEKLFGAFLKTTVQR
ncbi:MAG: methylmalonyl Co-A mutase-associated GTPase MeaB [Marinirhabdus sp.]